MAKKAKSKKIKNLWDKSSYWKKGGLVGLLFGVFFQILLYFLKLINFNIYGFNAFGILHIIPTLLYNIVLLN